MKRGVACYRELFHWLEHLAMPLFKDARNPGLLGTKLTTT